MSPTISGACHCGNISIHFHSHRLADIVPRECSCNLCRKHQASWISDPEGKVQVKYADPTQVSTYRFGTKTADFIICRQCGVLVAATCEIEGRLRAVLNIRCMPEAAFSSEPVATNFDDENAESRLVRRARSWTGEVIFE